MNPKSCAAMALVLLVACSNKKETGGGSGSSSTPPSSAPAKGGSQTADKDCATIDGDSAAAILGVPSVKPAPYAGHQKMSPGNMDMFACGYADAGPDPAGATLQYSTFMPIAADMAAVWESKQTGRHENMQSFAPNIGDASAGWASENPLPGGGYGAAIAFRTATKIFEIRVSGLPSADAAKAGVVKAATILQKVAGS